MLAYGCPHRWHKDSVYARAYLTQHVTHCVPAGMANKQPSTIAHRQRACLCMFNASCHALCACRYANEAAAPAAGLVLAKLLSTAGLLLENVHAMCDMLEETVIHFTPTQAGTPYDSDSSNAGCV